MHRSFFLALALVACSSTPSKPTSEPSSAPGKSAPTATSEPTAKRAVPDLKAEVGALDPKAVGKNFDALMKKAEKCHEDRRKQGDKFDFLAGDLKIEVVVSEDGSVKSAYFPQSTVGDRAIERCILEAARALSWPKPEGGAKGLAGNNLQLPMKGDREAVPWGPEKVEGTVAKAKSALSACKAGVKGVVEVTAYVDTDGKVITASASQPDPDKPTLPDCIVDAVKGLKFPSPGGWPAKVTFSVN